jgi:hypothetical protein
MIVKSWGVLLLASSLFLALSCLLTWLAIRFLRSNRDQLLATGRLMPEQELTISEPGELVLLLETPRLSSDYRNFEFEIVEQATGEKARMKYGYARAQGAVYGVTTMRVPLGRMIVQRVGPYLVRVAGLQAGRDYSGSRILFSRPYLGRMVLQILGIVLCATGMLLSLLAALWQVFPLQRDPSPVTSAASPSPGVPGRTIDLETWKRQRQQRHEEQPPKLGAETPRSSCGCLVTLVL